MALIDRISRLFKADLHAVLDQMEEPEHVLKQAIRDMEDELASTEKRIAQRVQDQAALASRTSELEASIAEIDRQLDLCFASGKDDLAKSLVRRKLEAARLAKRFNAKRTADEQCLEEQRARLREDSEALASLRQKAELFAHRPAARRAPDNDESIFMNRELTVGSDEVEIAYLHEKRARSGS